MITRGARARVVEDQQMSGNYDMKIRDIDQGDGKTFTDGITTFMCNRCEMHSSVLHDFLRALCFSVGRNNMYTRDVVWMSWQDRYVCMHLIMFSPFSSFQYFVSKFASTSLVSMNRGQWRHQLSTIRILVHH
jgi:hypothetical protein